MVIQEVDEVVDFNHVYYRWNN